MLWEYSFSFATSGFLILATILNLIKNCFKKKVKDSDIDKIFLDKDLEELFKDFTNAEYSTENVLCFLDIKKFYEIQNKDEKIEFAKKMKLLYFNGFSSEFEVNIAGSLIKQFDQHLMNLEFDELFFKIEPQIRLNLSDTYSRFIISFEYQEFLINNDYQKSFIKENKDSKEITEKRSILCRWYGKII